MHDRAPGPAFAAEPLLSARGIAFDCYGTLMRVVDDRGVTRRVARLLAGGAPAPVIEDLAIDAALRHAGVDKAARHLLADDLRAEVSSVELLPGARDVIAAARRRDLRLAIGSNLSREYAEPIRRLIPDVPACLSFEIGVRKPDPRFYEALAAAMQLAPHDIVMIGDSRRCDHDGARAAGFGAILLGPVAKDVITAPDVAAIAAVLDTMAGIP